MVIVLESELIFIIASLARLAFLNADGCKDGSFHVHCFTLSSTDTAALHGKIISSDRFRGLAESRPDRRLVEWHYKQCLMAHFRGFSAGMD